MAKDIIPPVSSSGPGSIEPSKEKPHTMPDRSKFDSYMESSSKTTSEGPSQISPAELSRGPLPQGTNPTLQSLLSQTETTHSNFENVKKLLETPNLRFRRSEESLLRNKLSEANTYLQGAAEKVGANITTPKAMLAKAGPVQKFLGMVTSGETQLEEARQTLMSLQESEGELRPADLMLVQVKLAQAQQNLEYASILLSKTVDIIKQMINIQL